MKLTIFLVFLFFQTTHANQNELVRDLFKNTQRFNLWKLKYQEITLGKAAQNSWLPLRIESSLYRTMPDYENKEEVNNLGVTPKEYADTFGVDLIYQNVSSLKNTFSVDYTKNTYDVAYSSTSTAKNYDISNRLEYNITNGGNYSDAKINQDEEILNLSISELQSLKTLNSDYLSFHQQFLNFIILDCKLKNQTPLKILVDETVKKGKALLDINSLSKKDYLNYENLQIDLEKNIAKLTNDLLQAKYDIESTGFNSDKDFDKNKMNTICQLKEFNDNLTIQDDLKKNIDLELIQKQIELNNLQLISARRDSVSDVKPFVEVGVESALTQRSKDFRIVAGVSVGWDFPNSRLNTQVKYRSSAKAYNAGDYQLTKKKVEFDAKSLSQDLKYLSQIIEITKRNLKSNDELLKILKLENSIKRGDSLNFASTVSNRVEMINNYFDLVVQAETKLAQYDFINNGRFLVK